METLEIDHVTCFFWQPATGRCKNILNKPAPEKGKASPSASDARTQRLVSLSVDWGLSMLLGLARQLFEETTVQRGPFSGGFLMFFYVVPCQIQNVLACFVQ